MFSAHRETSSGPSRRCNPNNANALASTSPPTIANAGSTSTRRPLRRRPENGPRIRTGADRRQTQLPTTSTRRGQCLAPSGSRNHAAPAARMIDVIAHRRDRPIAHLVFTSVTGVRLRKPLNTSCSRMPRDDNPTLVSPGFRRPMESLLGRLSGMGARRVRFQHPRLCPGRRPAELHDQ